MAMTPAHFSCKPSTRGATHTRSREASTPVGHSACVHAYVYACVQTCVCVLACACVCDALPYRRADGGSCCSHRRTAPSRATRPCAPRSRPERRSERARETLRALASAPAVRALWASPWRLPPGMEGGARSQKWLRHFPEKPERKMSFHMGLSVEATGTRRGRVGGWGRIRDAGGRLSLQIGH